MFYEKRSGICIKTNDDDTIVKFFRSHTHTHSFLLPFVGVFFFIGTKSHIRYPLPPPLPSTHTHTYTRCFLIDEVSITCDRLQKPFQSFHLDEDVPCVVINYSQLVQLSIHRHQHKTILSFDINRIKHFKSRQRDSKKKKIIINTFFNPKCSSSTSGRNR